MTIWNDMVIVLSLALVIYLVYKEMRRSNRARLGWRIAAVVLAVAALALLQIPVRYNRKIMLSGAGGEAVLVTEGYAPDSLQAFMKSSAGTRFIGADSIRDNPGASLAGVKTLHVFGYGPDPRIWELWDDSIATRLVFHQPAPGTGLVSVEWQRRIRPGKSLQIQGSCYRAEGDTVRLVLMGLNTRLDSVRLSGKGAGMENFQLSAIPAQSGQAVYRLLVLSGKDSIETESLPVEVLAPQGLRVLMLAAAPDPENRFLADWLSQNGYGLAVRTAISKDRTDKAWMNIPEMPLDHVNTILLDRCDLVIADAIALQDLPAGELSVLRRQVSEKGLGLIIKGDSPGGQAFYREFFPLAAVKDSTQSAYIRDRPGTLALMRDSAARIVAAKTLYGAGRLVFTIQQNTYARKLAGQEQAYSAWWSTILGAAGKEESAGEEWHFLPERPRVNEPVVLRLQSNETGWEEGRIGDAAVYLDQDPLLSFLRSGVYWPTHTGWQQAATPRGDSSRWYVWARDDWRGLGRRQRWKAAMDHLHAAEYRVMPAASQEDKKPGGVGMERVPVETGWFYALFVVCVLFLWVERKI